ncbi:MAG: hypothetical protein IH624_07345 [Phycisphaerae bacterium]|nr:hypothetical protein [Phycisphaerae bacterium]
MRRIHVLLGLFAIVLMAWPFRAFIRGRVAEKREQAEVVGTVEDRVGQYGPAVRGRLRPAFRQAAIAYPPARIALIIIKEEKRLEVWGAGRSGEHRFVKAYPILGASGRLGPKLREGDLQVPEGIYGIESLNPNSRFHLSLRIG